MTCQQRHMGIGIGTEDTENSHTHADTSGTPAHRTRTHTHTSGATHPRWTDAAESGCGSARNRMRSVPSGQTVSPLSPARLNPGIWGRRLGIDTPPGLLFEQLKAEAGQVHHWGGGHYVGKFSKPKKKMAKKGLHPAPRTSYFLAFFVKK